MKHMLSTLKCREVARGWSGWNQSSVILRNFASFIEFYRVSVSFSEL